MGKILRLSDFVPDLIPDCLKDDKNLPHLLFTTFESLVYLVKNFPYQFDLWGRTNLVHSIVLDEIHTFRENNFREVFGELHVLTSTRIRIISLSGSIHDMILPTVLK